MTSEVDKSTVDVKLTIYVNCFLFLKAKKSFLTQRVESDAKKNENLSREVAQYNKKAREHVNKKKRELTCG